MDGNKENKALSRRGFLTAAGMGALTLSAGCGGGGGNDGTPGERYNGTYFYRDGSGDITASVTIDRDGRTTFWSLDTGQAFTDYGQTRLSDRRFFFETREDDVETIADVNGNVIAGRTERISNQGYGFDWDAERQSGASRGRPPAEFVGTFYADTQVGGLDVYVLLGVSPDGNATFFGYFNDPSGNLIGAVNPLYVYEFLSIDPDGEGYDYFRNDNGDRISLRNDSSGLRLLYAFSLDDRFPPNSTPLTVNVGLTEGVSSRATRATAKANSSLARPRRGGAVGSDVLARLGESARRRKATGAQRPVSGR